MGNFSALPAPNRAPDERFFEHQRAPLNFDLTTADEKACLLARPRLTA